MTDSAPMIPPPSAYGLPAKFDKWREHQAAAVVRAVAADKRFPMIVAPTGCHAAGTGVLLFNGSTKLVEDVQIGDRLIGPDGRPRTVIDLHAGTSEMFEVRPVKGNPFIVNGDHLLSIYKLNEGDRYPCNAPRIETMTPREWLTAPKYHRHVRKLRRSGPVEFSKRKRFMPIDPYFLGVLIGDGTAVNSIGVCTPDHEIVACVREQAVIWGLAVRESQKPNNKATDYYLTSGKGGRHDRNPLINALAALGMRVVCENKFVPDDYLTAPINIRRQVLAGLLDTDGYLHSKGFEITCKGTKLRDNILFLARSLGLAAYASAKTAPKICDTVYWRIAIAGETSLIPTRIKRKQAAARQQIKSVLVTGFTVKSVGPGDYFGFEVDRDHLYLTSDFTIHHNSGKSVIAESIARYTGRSAYLTITKGLQSQIGSEFSDRFDIRGKSNYDCRLLVDGGMRGWQSRVDQADVMCDGCAYREAGCKFYDDMRRARREPRLITNYSKWLATGSELLGEFDVLVCDEAHGLAEQLSKSMRIEIKPESVERFANQPLPRTQEMGEWAAWASRWFDKLKPRLDGIASRVAAGERHRAAEMRELKGLCRGLEALTGVGEGWIEDRSDEQRLNGARVAWEPVWPRKYGERLFRGIKKVLLTSATVNRKDAELVGIDPSEIDFAEYPSSFPVASRPFVWVPTVVQRNAMSDGERLEAVRRVDQIIEQRLDRKIIIDTVSFDRARHMLQHSRYASIMMLNDPQSRDERQGTQQTVDRFKLAVAPRVLVTPSVKEGYDFPYSECETLIILKVPLLNRHSSAVSDARCKEDPEYDGFQAMKGIVQRAGRGMRAEDDKCEVICVDDTWGNWFLRANRKFAPNWFLAAVRGPEPIPRPLEKLRK